MAHDVREISREGDRDYPNYDRNYKRIFKVITDEWNVDPRTVATYVSPAVGDHYLTDTYVDAHSICKKITARPNEPGVWTVECDYDSKPWADEGNRDTAPTSRPPIVNYDSVLIQLPFTKDQDDKDVLNSSNQPFNPPVMQDVAFPTISITKVVASPFDSTNVDFFTNAINGTDWTLLGRTYARRTLLCTKYKANSQWEQGALFWQLDIELKQYSAVHGSTDTTWNPIKILDAGTMTKGPTGEPGKKITDATGNEITTPVRLDGTGLVLASDGTSVYLPFRMYREVEFSGMW